MQGLCRFGYCKTVSYWRKYVHEVLVNRIGGLSLPRKSVVRLTDRPVMTLDVYRGRKTTMQMQHIVRMEGQTRLSEFFLKMIVTCKLLLKVEQEKAQ